MTSKIGFCCKWISPSGDASEEKSLNQVDVTLSRLSRLEPKERESLLWEKMTHNLASLQKLVTTVSQMPATLRMFRITSDLLPCYTHELVNSIYKQNHFQVEIEKAMNNIGEISRSTGTRLIFHPDHFVRLNSADDVITTRAIECLELHADLYRMMGFSSKWHDSGVAMNIHLGGREGGIDGFRRGFNLLSDEAKRLITVENDEFSFGLDDLAHVADLCPIVTDIYHEWVFTKGEYLQADDSRIQDIIIPSWRGVRPLGHFSQPKEALMPGQKVDVLPSYQEIKDYGLSAIKMRSHSYDCWNVKMNEWALTHLPWMDIEVEAKGKNIAANTLYQQLIST